MFPKIQGTATTNDQGRVFGLLQLIYLLEVHGNTSPYKERLLEITFEVITKFCQILLSKRGLLKYILQLFCLWVFFEKEKTI